MILRTAPNATRESDTREPICLDEFADLIEERAQAQIDRPGERLRLVWASDDLTDGPLVTGRVDFVYDVDPHRLTVRIPLGAVPPVNLNDGELREIKLATDDRGMRAWTGWTVADLVPAADALLVVLEHDDESTTNESVRADFRRGA